MDKSLPHILIVEREFLIALDAEFLIKSAITCRVTLIRPEQLDQWKEDALQGVDLCLLDVPLDASRVVPRIKRLVAEGVPLLFSTVGEAHRSGVDGFESVPVVMKPFDGDTLVALVMERLPHRPQPPGRKD